MTTPLANDTRGPKLTTPLANDARGRKLTTPSLANDAREPKLTTPLANDARGRKLTTPSLANLDTLWSRHHAEWREPAQVISQWPEATDTDPTLLRYTVHGA